MALNHELVGQRLVLCTFLAIVVHGLVVFGLDWPDHPTLANLPLRAFEVTLVTQVTNKTPQSAEFIAPNMQVASEVSVDQSLDDRPLSAAEITNPQHIEWYSIVTSRTAPHSISNSAVATFEQDLVSNPQLDNLYAKLAQQQYRYQQQTKKRTVTVDALAAAEAEYLSAWRAKVENIGNQYYSTAVEQADFFGSVLLLVAINTDGTLHEVHIRQSSGNKILDAAALHIVELAAPFPPLPPAVRQDTQVLEIIRTWQFGKDNRWHTAYSGS